MSSKTERRSFYVVLCVVLLLSYLPIVYLVSNGAITNKRGYWASTATAYGEYAYSQGDVEVKPTEIVVGNLNSTKQSWATWRFYFPEALSLSEQMKEYGEAYVVIKDDAPISSVGNFEVALDIDNFTLPSWRVLGGGVASFEDGDILTISPDTVNNYVFYGYKETSTYFLSDQEEAYYATLITDDNQTNFWTLALGGTGTLNISISDEEAIKKTGTNSLKIVSSSGADTGYSDYEIYHAYSPAADWSGKDCICFWMYGSNTGQLWNIFVNAPDKDNQLLFSFRDTWSGWKRVILPFKSCTRNGSPDLGNIVLVRFGPITTYPDIEGIWYLDRIVTDTESVYSSVQLRKSFSSDKYDTVVIEIPYAKDVIWKLMMLVDGNWWALADEHGVGDHTTDGIFRFYIPPGHNCSRPQFQINNAVNGKSGMIKIDNVKISRVVNGSHVQVTLNNHSILNGTLTYETEYESGLFTLSPTQFLTNKTWSSVQGVIYLYLLHGPDVFKVENSLNITVDTNTSWRVSIVGVRMYAYPEHIHSPFWQSLFSCSNLFIVLALILMASFVLAKKFYSHIRTCP